MARGTFAIRGVASNLGFLEAIRCVGSYVWVRIHPPKDTSNLEGFFTEQFGTRLYEHFFKHYTEEVFRDYAEPPAAKAESQKSAETDSGSESEETSSE